MTEKINKNLVPIVVVVLGLIIIGFFSYFNQFSLKDIGKEKAGERAIEYINNNLLAPGVIASLVEVTDEGGVYKVSLQIKQEENVLGEIESYIGKDGIFFFPEGYNMDESLNNNFQENPENPVPETQEEPLSIEEAIKMDSFVQCLSEANFVVYASRTCPACASLISQFGGYDVAAPILIECSESWELCEEKNITAVPTIFINDQEYKGNRSLESFAQETGCIL